MYLITRSKITCNKCTAISKYVYRVETLKGLDLPRDAGVFKKANVRKVRIGSKRVKPSFNLMILDSALQDNHKLRRMLKRSLALKIAPSHFIFPNLDYDSLKYKKIFRQSEFSRKWGDTKIITSLHPIDVSTQLILEKIAQENIAVMRDKIKRNCLSLKEGNKEKKDVSKKTSDLRGKLRILKTKCQVYSLFLKLNLDKEYMKAYLTFNRSKKYFDRINESTKHRELILSNSE